MKHFIALFLAVCMLCTFASCGETPAVTTGEVGAPVGEITAAPETTEATTAATEPAKNYPDNILMADSQTTRSAPVFGNEAVTREDILTVTFKGTLAEMPADAWDVSDAKDGSVMAWVTDGVNLCIAGEGGVTAKSCSRLFAYYTNATSIDFGGCFYTDLTEDLYEMFVHCEKLESLDLSGWNTENVTLLTSMFYYCSRMTSVDLGGWDTSAVTNMKGVFQGCQKLESVDVSHFDTANVTTFESMFYACRALTALDVSAWNTANVQKMTDMFTSCESLTSLDLSGWDTAKVDSMYGMFEYSGVTAVGDLKIPEGCETTDMFNGTPLA